MLARLLILCALCGALLAPAWADDTRGIAIFAAASLQDTLSELAPEITAQTGQDVILVPAGSSSLARQIQQGAPADIFISANPQWMDLLESQGALVPGSRRDLLSNSLALIAPAGPAPQLDLSAPEKLLAALGRNGRFAIALPQAVPAGIYGRQALETLGLWTALAPRLAQTDNVRAALALVATGAAPLGLVYGSDVLADKRVQRLAEIPASSHDPIRYPAAQIKTARPEAAQVLKFLASPAAQRVFLAHGFLAP
ncbi:MAG: molybdate ABC transporter substrate-binding protein [Mangrovicoccus sp.]|nr:molybdate ABC transporter substrate-binding protein [Mangrovicoccus sp.]